MKKLRTLIVDDEPLALDLMQSYLEQFEQIEVVAKCKNGREAIDACNNLHPDLMFLDIQMPGFSGMDVVARLQSDSLPMIVFVTAYDEYALEAFNIHAVDYLLKPIEADKLARSIKRCQNRYQQEIGVTPDKEKLMEAIDGLTSSADAQLDSDKTDQYPRIVVKDRGTITIIEQPEIDWIDAAGDYVCIHVEGVTHIMRNTMKGIVSQLDPSLFQRIHRSTIVNLTRIQKVIPHTKGECFLDLGGGEQIKVSRNYREIIQNYLNSIQ